MPLLKLPADLKGRWLAWLRDPANRQGKNMLVNATSPTGPTYCCLGGLGQICGVTDRQMFATSTFVGLHRELVAKQIWTQDQYAEVLAVLHQHGPDVFVSVQSHLVGMNDAHGKSFLEIAEWIEANL